MVYLRYSTVYWLVQIVTYYPGGLEGGEDWGGGAASPLAADRYVFMLDSYWSNGIFTVRYCLLIGPNGDLLPRWAGRGKGLRRRCCLTSGSRWICVYAVFLLVKWYIYGTVLFTDWSKWWLTTQVGWKGERTEEELLPHLWQQIDTKYVERRLLAGEAVGLLCPHVSREWQLHYVQCTFCILSKILMTSEKLSAYKYGKSWSIF